GMTKWSPRGVSSLKFFMAGSKPVSHLSACTAREARDRKGPRGSSAFPNGSGEDCERAAESACHRAGNRQDTGEGIQSLFIGNQDEPFYAGHIPAGGSCPAGPARPG